MFSFLALFLKVAADVEAFFSFCTVNWLTPIKLEVHSD